MGSTNSNQNPSTGQTQQGYFIKAYRNLTGVISYSTLRGTFANMVYVGYD